MKYHFSSLFIKAQASLIALLMLVFSLQAQANNGGVHGPIVKNDTAQFDWRTTFSPAENDVASDLWAQRVHFQQALNSQLRYRAVLQIRQQGPNTDREWKYDAAKIELLYNFNKFGEQDNFASAIRFDLRTRRGSRPEDFAVQWTNQLNLDAKNYVRAILLVGKNLSGNVSRGLRVGTRFAYYHRLNATYNIGLELFDQYGEISNIAAYDEQTHQIGPAVMAKFGRLQVFGRYLTGLTSATPDHNFSLRLIYNF